MGAVGVIAGLPAEAALLRRAQGIVVYCHGPGPENAARAARTALDDGCMALVSFGVAGGLDPALGPGNLVLAEAVISAEGERLAVDPFWRERLARLLPGAGGDLLGMAGPVSTPAEKSRLRAATGAVAVDMESLAVGRAVATVGAPFLIVRAVADPAWRSIPDWAAELLDAGGQIRRRAALATVGLRPDRWGQAWRLAAESRRALLALGRAVARVGPGLGFRGEFLG